MPRMKELQDLLAELDAEGGLNIGGAENGEPANLDDLYEDSYFHAILHKSVKESSIKVATNNENKDKEEDEGEEEEKEDSKDTTTEPLTFNVLTLPRECSWGDDHESLGHQMLVRPGYAAVLTALTSAPASRPDGSPVIYMAAGSTGIGKSCLAYYLAFKLFELGHDIVISDPMFTNAFLQDQYYSCYSPHLTRHQAIFDAISSAPSSSSSEKPIWWICDDGYLPVRHTQCHVLVNTTTAVSGPSQKDVDIESPESVPSISPEQEAVLEGLFKKFKSNPRKIFGWVKTNWVTPAPSSPSSSTSFTADASSLLGTLKSKKSKKSSK
ncbi:hypothetical protein BGZ81_000693 [Podila clonocystis]|nr:hypothetical protein BGZ81_000693 [Podila clonocystis]